MPRETNLKRQMIVTKHRAFQVHVRNSLLAEINRSCLIAIYETDKLFQKYFFEINASLLPVWLRSVFLRCITAVRFTGVVQSVPRAYVAKLFKISKGIADRGIKGRRKLAYALCIIWQIRIREGSWPEDARAEIFHENRSYRSCLPLFWHPFVMQRSKYIPCLPRIRIIVLTWMRIFNV